MKITKSASRRIVSFCNDIDYETGGILGAVNDVIDHVIFDRGEGTQKCSYIPDVVYLNKSISRWAANDINFLGIYHTHFLGVETLSAGDINYIKMILSAMPESIMNLYFPIVLPEYQRIIPYIAKRTQEGICVLKDELQIIDDYL